MIFLMALIASLIFVFILPLLIEAFVPGDRPWLRRLDPVPRIEDRSGLSTPRFAFLQLRGGGASSARIGCPG